MTYPAFGVTVYVCVYPLAMVEVVGLIVPPVPAEAVMIRPKNISSDRFAVTLGIVYVPVGAPTFPNTLSKRAATPQSGLGMIVQVDELPELTGEVHEIVPPNPPQTLAVMEYCTAAPA